MVLAYRRNPRLVLQNLSSKRKKKFDLKRFKTSLQQPLSCFKMGFHFKTLAKVSSSLFQKKKKISLLLQIRFERTLSNWSFVIPLKLLEKKNLPSSK
jgi:hypothetical protein